MMATLSACLIKLFSSLKKRGPALGYHLTKCDIITKEHLFEKAQQIFVHDEVQIVEGSVIASEYAERKFVERSPKQQKSLLKKLAAHANVSPQNVYKSFTSSVQHNLTFLARLTPDIEDLLKECEESINDKLLPNLLKNPPYNQKYREIFSLPIMEDGLNILKPEDCFKEYGRSVQLSSPLSLSLHGAKLKRQQIIQEMKKEKELAIKSKKTRIKCEFYKNEIRSLYLASEKGASSSLNAMPLKRYHFDLTKSVFRDGIALRYVLDSVKITSLCSCNENFTLAHALNCPKGG